MCQLQLCKLTKMINILESQFEQYELKSIIDFNDNDTNFRALKQAVI